MRCDICSGEVKPRGREYYIMYLRPGDIFFASSNRLPILICLVENIDENSIYSRVVTTQLELVFSRPAGHSTCENQNDPCIIKSVEPLPIETHNIILGLDRKMRLHHEVSEGLLDELEKQALIFAQEHYRNFPLPITSGFCRPR